MSHPLQGYRFVRQADGTDRVYKPDGTFHGVARRTRGSTPPATQRRGRVETATKRPPATTTRTAPTTVRAAPPSTGRYVVVSWLVADDEARRAAQKAADRCADDLGITRTTVRWFDEATPVRLLEAGDHPERFDTQDCRGIYRPEVPNAVYIKLTSDPNLAAEVAAHEQRHRWQFKVWGPPATATDEATYEKDARRYGEEQVARKGFPW